MPLVDRSVKSNHVVEGCYCDSNAATDIAGDLAEVTYNNAVERYSLHQY